MFVENIFVHFIQTLESPLGKYFAYIFSLSSRLYSRKYDAGLSRRARARARAVRADAVPTVRVPFCREFAKFATKGFVKPGFLRVSILPRGRRARREES